jgi:uncharacterized protein (TIGR03437 family)
MTFQCALPALASVGLKTTLSRAIAQFLNGYQRAGKKALWNCSLLSLCLTASLQCQTLCPATLSPTVIAAGSSATNAPLSIQTSATCTWTIQGLPPWISSASAINGIGPGVITFGIAPNPGPARTAAVYVAGIAVFVNQLANGSNTPTVSANGVVPLNSTVPIIQSGSLISVWGTNLSTSTAASDGSFPTSLSGVSVSINNKPGYLFYVSPDQINLQAPDDTATGSVGVVVTTPYGVTAATVTLATFAPSLCLFDGTYAAGVVPTPDGKGAYHNGAYDLIGPAGRFSFPTRPARAGDVVELYGVGFGPTVRTAPAGQVPVSASATTTPVRVTIGGIPATVLFSGTTLAGLYQLNVVIPPNSGTGDQQLVATVGGVQTPGKVFLTIQ